MLAYAGASPPPRLAGSKDTVLVLPGKKARLAVGFADYADPHLPYMFHCHPLQHEDQGMMGQLVAVEPGQRPHVHRRR